MNAIILKEHCHIDDIPYINTLCWEVWDTTTDRLQEEAGEAHVEVDITIGGWTEE